MKISRYSTDDKYPCSYFPVTVVKNLPASAGDTGLILGSGRSPGEGNGYLLQYSCLENPMDRGAWWATVHGVTKRWMRLSECACIQAQVYIVKS